PKKIDATVARHLDVRVVCDNYRTHKTKEVQAWLAKHPRFKMHYTPTSSSWLNLVERLFAEISRQQTRRGAFKSVADLEAAIDAWIVGDRDAYQLASEATTILQPIRAGELARIGPAEVRERYGVDPEQVPDFIALRGDASDRIPGAKGIGEKGAASVLRKYGSLEN